MGVSGLQTGTWNPQLCVAVERRVIAYDMTFGMNEYHIFLGCPCGKCGAVCLIHTLILIWFSDSLFATAASFSHPWFSSKI